MVEIILDLIKKSGITNNKLLSDLNLPSSAITEWKKGKAKPSVDALMKIADYFDCSVDYLLGLESKTPPSPILMDDFTYALYNETKELTDKQKQAILDMAKAFKDSQK